LKNLLTAIFGKTAGSTLSTSVGGRIFLDEAPADSEFPYAVFQVVNTSPERTFTEDFEETSIQFSIYSDSLSATEISTIQGYLDSLFDEGSTFAVTGSTLIWMRRNNTVTMTDNITTDSGTFTLRHWATDFDILVSKD